MLFKYYKFIQIILVLVPVLALGYFGYEYINPSGILIINYDFCQKETPYFSGFSPNGRVLKQETSNKKQETKEKKCFQRMIIDPVYFDVRLPQSYRAVQIELDYEKSENQDFKIGIGIDSDNWKWEFDSGIMNYELGIMDFNLDLNEAKFENNRYRFIISAPGLSESKEEIIFYNIKLKFEKEALTIKNVKSRLRNFIGFN